MRKITEETNREFVKTALNIYENLSFEEKSSLKYTSDLIKILFENTKTKNKFDTFKKECYEHFSFYCRSHYITKHKKYQKFEKENVLLEDIQRLLRYDIFRKKIKKALKGTDIFYRYYWFDPIVTTNNYEKQKRRILIFESDVETIETTYELMVNWFDWCESIYCGFGGISMIFFDSEKEPYFQFFLDAIEKNNPRNQR